MICEVLYILRWCKICSIKGNSPFGSHSLAARRTVASSISQKNWGQRSDSKITTKHFRRYVHPNHQEGCRFGLESKPKRWEPIFKSTGTIVPSVVLCPKMCRGKMCNLAKLSVFPVAFCAEPVYPYNSIISNQPTRIFFVAQERLVLFCSQASESSSIS